MKNKPFNSVIFLISVFCIGLLTLMSLIAAAAEEEGTGIGIISNSLAHLYLVLRFPTHTLFSFITENGWSYFLIGLAINTIFYGFIAERLFAVKISK